MSEMSTEELFGTVGIALDWVGDVFLKMDNISDNPSSVDDLFGTNLVKKIIHPEPAPSLALCNQILCFCSLKKAPSSEK